MKVSSDSSESPVRKVELLILARAGCDLPMEYLYPFIRSVAYHAAKAAGMRCHSDCEDLVQELVLRLLKTRTFDPQKCEDDAALEKYISRTARRMAIDSYRQKKRRRQINAGGNPIAFEQSAVAPDDTVEDMIVAETVGNAVETIDDIPPEFADAFRLFLHGLGPKAASVALNIPEGTVKSRTYSAAIKLREAYWQRRQRSMAG